MKQNRLPNFQYKIIEHCGTLSDTGTQSKQLNLVSYNGAPAKFDLRTWLIDRESGEPILGKGITLSQEEALFLKEILDGREDLDG